MKPHLPLERPAPPAPRRTHGPTRAVAGLLVAAGLAWATPGAARDASTVSAVSLLPVVVSVAAADVSAIASGRFVLRAVEASATGTVLWLENLADGARLGLRLAAGASQRLSAHVGQSVQASASAAGWVLTVGAEAIAIVPSAVGQALLHHERIDR